MSLNPHEKMGRTYAKSVLREQRLKNRNPMQNDIAGNGIGLEKARAVLGILKKKVLGGEEKQETADFWVGYVGYLEEEQSK